ncbi:hypothetical protein ACFE04_022684 [Oxalis oulophora]
MSVVGFDIGNDNCVIAAVKQRGIDVLLNEESNRETPAVVCFGEKQRFLGPAGAASATMNPKSTISQLKRLIGQKFSDPIIQDELKMFPFEISEGLDGGILIKLKYMGETHAFTPVQLMGMLFAHLKDTAEKNLEIPVVDCVIGIPSYFTDLQRRAYLNAAAIAGLKPLRLVHDCTATALSYGIYKSDFSGGGPTYVAFVDIGHCDTQVSIVSFTAGHMKVLSHAFDSNLGGRNFDEILFKYFAAQFKQQYNIDVYSNVRASIRLRAACEKLKKVLSANAEAPLNIECLMDEKDIGPFQGSHSDKAKVKIRVQLNLHGIVTIDLAFLVEEDSSTGDIEAECVPADSGNGDSGTSMPIKSSRASADGMVKEKGTRRLEIPVSENIYGGMTMAELAQAHEKEIKLAQQDIIMEQTKEKKNALESYVYDMRNKNATFMSLQYMAFENLKHVGISGKLFNTYRSFATDQERDGISRNLQETEEWLYEDGDDETQNAYNLKLENLKKLVDPIENRYKDGEARVEAARDLVKYIVDCRTAALSLPTEQRELILNECNKSEEWLSEKMQQQESLPKHVDPVLWSSEINSRIEELKSLPHMQRRSIDTSENTFPLENSFTSFIVWTVILHFVTTSDR